MIGYRLFETDHGFAAAAWSRNALCGFWLPSETEEATRSAVSRRMIEAMPAEPPAAIAALIADVRRYFQGACIDFVQVPIDLGSQTPLFARIYEHVRGLGWGQTTTYGTVARQFGLDPAGARVVGQAMARNPIPLIVPCHRVLAAGGGLGGFSAPGGTNAKVRMLAMEGALSGVPDRMQTSFGF